MPPPLLASVLSVLTHGLNTNSYKFALLRALADHGRRGATEDLVSLPRLAEVFLRYYWPLTVTFRVRQATDPTRDPVIMRFIRDEARALGLPPGVTLDRYRHGHPKRYESLVDRCCRPGGCFDEVIPRFHTVRRHPVRPPLYERVADGIHLTTGTREFLGDYHRVLENLAIGAWVRFTEQFSVAPRLYDKIAGLPSPRGQGRYRSTLEAIQGRECFYCRAGLPPRLHVDHVIPWAFVAEDRLWNLVLACDACNVDKRDHPPTEAFVQALIQRNMRLMADLKTGKLAHMGRVAIRDLREAIGLDLGEHLLARLAECRAEGFEEWLGPRGRAKVGDGG